VSTDTGNMGNVLEFETYSGNILEFHLLYWTLFDNSYTWTDALCSWLQSRGSSNLLPYSRIPS